MEELPEVAVEKLARVNKLLRTQKTLPPKLEAVVALAKRTIVNCDAAGISLLIEGEPTTCAVTDRLTVEIDLVQYETGQGPCLAAMSESNVVRIDILERDSRFTRFAPGALAGEIHSVLSIPLTAGAGTVGALNLYSHRPDAFDARSEELVRPMAEYAAEVISTSPLYAYSLDLVEGLRETLEARALIAQAAGVMMVTEKRTSDEAFDHLRQLALTSGESMRTVAQWVLEERPTGPALEEHEETARREE